jgi:hypothetical protein
MSQHFASTVRISFESENFNLLLAKNLISFGSALELINLITFWAAARWERGKRKGREGDE